MSILRLEKVTLYGRAVQKADVLARLQELGALHLERLTPKPVRPEEAPPAYPRDTYAALRYLHATPLKRRPVTDSTGFDMGAVVQAALENRRQRRRVRDRIDELRESIREAEPWGDFELPPIDALRGYRLWFYTLPLHKLRQLPREGLVWQVVQQDHRQAHVVVVSKDEPSPDLIPVPRNHRGTRSLAALRSELEEAETEGEELAAERWYLSRWTGLIQRHLAHAEDAAFRRHAAAQALDAGEIFALQGWVPVRRRKAVEALAEADGLAVTFEAPTPEEQPPVLLDNPEPVAGGEGLVSFYQLPGYRDWDPSAVIFWSFALFFAMILADAGYGMLLGLILGLLWRPLGRSAAGRRWRHLLTAVTGASMGYGVLVGSYFGLAPPEGSLLERLRLLDVGDFQAMMKLSIAVGLLHLMLANGTTAWHRRRSLRALPSLGWFTFLTVALLYLAGAREVALTVGPWLAAGGAVAILAFSGDQPLRRPRDMLWRLLDGLKGLTGLSQAFGDVLSYLRLFALGLSSASLAQTFNELARPVMGSGRGIALLLGLLILTLGHGLNFLLALMSGVVHGLRLNLIEMYNWSIYGEGRPFRAFRKKENATWTA